MTLEVDMPGMNKKTKIIIIVALAVVVVGGVYYAYNNWRKQKLLRDYLTQLGVPESQLGDAAKQMSTKDLADIYQGMAGDEYEEEKPKTPKQLYEESTAVEVFDDNSKSIVNETKSFIEQVFGKAKLTSISGGYMGVKGSGIAAYRLSRKIQSDDVTFLNKALTDRGFTIFSSSIDGKDAMIMAMKGEAEQITVSFTIDEQDIGIFFLKVPEE